MALHRVCGREAKWRGARCARGEGEKKRTWSRGGVATFGKRLPRGRDVSPTRLSPGIDSTRGCSRAAEKKLAPPPPRSTIFERRALGPLDAARGDDDGRRWRPGALRVVSDRVRAPRARRGGAHAGPPARAGRVRLGTALPAAAHGRELGRGGGGARTTRARAPPSSRGPAALRPARSPANDRGGWLRPEPRGASRRRARARARRGRGLGGRGRAPRLGGGRCGPVGVGTVRGPGAALGGRGARRGARRGPRRVRLERVRRRDGRPGRRRPARSDPSARSRGGRRGSSPASPPRGRGGRRVAPRVHREPRPVPRRRHPPVRARGGADGRARRRGETRRRLRLRMRRGGGGLERERKQRRRRRRPRPRPRPRFGLPGGPFAAVHRRGGAARASGHPRDAPPRGRGPPSLGASALRRQPSEVVDGAVVPRPRRERRERGRRLSRRASLVVARPSLGRVRGRVASRIGGERRRVPSPRVRLLLLPRVLLLLRGGAVGGGG